MKQRWYDRNPTLSMAVSLLHNAETTHQEMAARYIFSQLENSGLLDSAEFRSKGDRLRFLFPSFRRHGFEMHARHLIELLKHLPADEQHQVALQLIHYIYILDGSMRDPTLDMIQMLDAGISGVEEESLRGEGLG